MVIVPELLMEGLNVLPKLNAIFPELKTVTEPLMMEEYMYSLPAVLIVLFALIVKVRLETSNVWIPVIPPRTNFATVGLTSIVTV